MLADLAADAGERRVRVKGLNRSRGRVVSLSC